MLGFTIILNREGWSEGLLAQQQAAQLNNLVALNATVDKLIGAKTVEQVRQILIESKVADR